MFESLETLEGTIANASKWSYSGACSSTLLQETDMFLLSTSPTRKKTSKATWNPDGPQLLSVEFCFCLFFSVARDVRLHSCNWGCCTSMLERVVFSGSLHSNVAATLPHVALQWARLSPQYSWPRTSGSACSRAQGGYMLL